MLYKNYINYLADFNLPKRRQIHEENLSAFASKKTVENENIKNYTEAVNNWVQTKTYSMSEFSIQTITIDEVKKTLGRQWKKVLKTAYPLIYWLYGINRHSKRIVEIFLSSCSEFLIERIGTQQTVNNTIHKLEKVGVIQRVPFVIDGKEYSASFGGNKFSWCREHGFDNGQTFTSKFQGVAIHYIINPIIINELYKFCKELFGKYNWRTLWDDVVSVDFDRDDYLEYVPVIKKALYKDGVYTPFRNINLKCNIFGSKKKATLYITRFMYENDPRFKFGVDLRSELNANIQDEDLKGVFEPTFHFSKSGETITKIGIRNWCNMALFKSHENKDVIVKKDNGFCIEQVSSNSNYTGRLFKDECIKKFGNVGKEYDSNGNIPRVLYFQNYGVWLPQSVCMYELMFGVKFNGNKFIKKLHKSVALPAIFTASRDKYIYNSTLYYTKTEREIQEEAGKLGEYTPDDYANYTHTLIHNFLPVINGTECFMVESIIFMLLEKQLQMIGIKDYVIKYDAVYLFHDEKIDFNKMLTDAAYNYKEMFMKDVTFLSEPTGINKEMNVQPVSTIDNLRI